MSYPIDKDLIEAPSKNDTAFGTQIADTREYNIGDSNYSDFKIQPWDIWLEYSLNPWDADIIKRVLRTKKSQCRKADYEKIIHVCKERIRQIENS
jgi:DNA-directed RNA polymerase sigma subunit (sigma70/sigma32)